MYCEFAPKISKEDKEKSKDRGGSDVDDWGEYGKNDGTAYYDKDDHKERSRHNDNGQHDKHKR